MTAFAYIKDAMIRWFGVLILFLVPLTIQMAWHYPATVDRPGPEDWTLKIPSPPSKPILLEEVWRTGVLKVATRYSPSTYYQGAEGATGFGHDLVAAFGRDMGVRVEFLVYDSLGEIIQAVSQGEAHMAAAGLTITKERRDTLRFTQPYQDVHVQLVYRQGETRPRDLADTSGSYIHVLADSSHLETLSRLRQEHLGILPQPHCLMDLEEMLAHVASGEYDYALADSNEMAIIRHFYPELRTAFDIGQPRHLAWAFSRNAETSLLHAANRFLEKSQDNGLLARLKERYYGHLEEFDYVGTRAFIRHVSDRLPRFERLFKQAAKKYGLDWRLLAAIGYQESHWEPDAVSPTGVRGIMMLTQATARQVEIDNRTDPGQSIVGGARYVVRVKDKIPERIPEPDRTWMALAAYNVGFGHLEDARKLTQGLGHDPDRWADVREHLPLLSRKKWYERTEHGFARGWEPVDYVENIRTYHDILVWLTEREQRRAWLALRRQGLTQFGADGGQATEAETDPQRPQSVVEALRRILPPSI